MGDCVPDTCSERAPARPVWCFIGAAALSGDAVGARWSLGAVVAEGAVDAGAWCVAACAGSADSSAPVMDWKPASLVDVMAMLFRRMAAALGAYCAPGWCCSAAVNREECLDSNEARGFQTLGGNAANTRWTAPRRRVVDAGEVWRAAGGCLHWQRGCGAGGMCDLRCDEA